MSDVEFEKEVIEYAGYQSVDIPQLHQTESPALLDFAVRVARKAREFTRKEILQSEEIKGLLTVANKWADYDDGEMREALSAFRAKFGKGEG